MCVLLAAGLGRAARAAQAGGGARGGAVPGHAPVQVSARSSPLPEGAEVADAVTRAGRFFMSDKILLRPIVCEADTGSAGSDVSMTEVTVMGPCVSVLSLVVSCRRRQAAEGGGVRTVVWLHPPARCPRLVHQYSVMLLHGQAFLLEADGGPEEKFLT